MKEIIEQLNKLEIHQTSSDFLEDIPEDLFAKYFKKCVDDNLDVNKHRWYETSISVFEILEGLIGVCSITDTFSESMEYSDVDHYLTFFEMEAIPSVTYKIKK